MSVAMLPAGPWQASGYGVLKPGAGARDDQRQPESPRATRPRRKAVQPAPSSVVMRSIPKNMRWPLRE